MTISAHRRRETRNAPFRCGLFVRFLLVLVPIFLFFSAAGLTILNRHASGNESLALAARVGNRAARVADALARHDPRNDQDLARDLLNPLANDPAVRCVELWLKDGGTPAAALPPGLGCTGVGPANDLSLDVSDDGASTLLVRFSDAEIVNAMNARRDLTAMILGAAFVLAVASAGIGFRMIVARPLGRLREAIQRATETGERIGVRASGANELTDIIGVYNKMIARDAEREQALDQINADLRRSQDALRDLNTTLESRIAQRTLELNAEKLLASAASDAKSRFLSTMSHEIRTPLNAVLGITDSLRGRLTEPEHDQAIEAIHGSGALLMRIINDILDCARLDANQMAIEEVPFAPGAPAQRVVSILGPSAAEKGIALRIRSDPELPRVVYGDPGRIHQILTNLVSNAVKFTDVGSVTIAVNPVVIHEETTLIEWIVEDTGIGIRPGFMDDLFTEFTQADPTISRRFGGSGLGLAISKRLTERMGGTISCASEPGRGSCFRVVIPLKTATRAVPTRSRSCDTDTADLAACMAEAARVRGGAIRILVAEDNAVNQMVIRKLLDGYNVRLDVVADGVQAVAAAVGGDYDAIFMDMSMPGMDGLEATRLIRARGGELADVPIIALTANAFPEDRNAAFEAGMTQFVSKPVSKDKLLSTLCGALSDATAARSLESRPA